MTMFKPLCLAAALTAALSGAARADAVEDFYKGKTIFALVGVSPGGEYDFQLRLVAKHLGKYIPGHPNIIAQNMTGATGMVMANYLYKVAAKDGAGWMSMVLHPQKPGTMVTLQTNGWVRTLDLRSGEVTASPFSCPDCTCGNRLAMPSISTSTLPISKPRSK